MAARPGAETPTMTGTAARRQIRLALEHLRRGELLALHRGNDLRAGAVRVGSASGCGTRAGGSTALVGVGVHLPLLRRERQRLEQRHPQRYGLGLGYRLVPGVGCFPEHLYRRGGVTHRTDEGVPHLHDDVDHHRALPGGVLPGADQL